MGGSFPGDEKSVSGPYPVRDVHDGSGPSDLRKRSHAFVGGAADG